MNVQTLEQLSGEVFLRNASIPTDRPSEPTFVIGQEDSGRCVGGMQLLERSYQARTRTARHDHDYACLDLIIRGIASDSYRRVARVAPTGSVLYYAPGESHTWACGDHGARLLHLIIPSKMLIQPRGRVGEDGCDLSATRAPAIAFQILPEYRCGDTSSGLAIESLCSELLAEVFELPCSESQPPRWMRQVTELLHDAPDGRIDLQFIAAEVRVHPGHLARSFRVWNRCTPGQYLRHLRLSRAAVQLANSRFPLVQIALDAGFADQAHFCRDFKRYFGVTPGTYRSTMSEI